MSLLDVQALYAGYDDTEILHGVNFSIDKAEVVTIIGPNGAGKSTLLKTIMGYATRTGGSVTLDGKDITMLRSDERVSCGIAYVPQLENVFPSLTAEENLRMGGYTLSKSELRRRMELQYESFPRIAERRKQRVHTMSGGERQMLALARALMTEPRLMLLDEPSAAMSPKLAQQVFDTIRDINRQGRAVVLVEQEARGSLEISDRGYALVDGRNAFEGPADRILKDEKLRETFLGVG